MSDVCVITTETQAIIEAKFLSYSAYSEKDKLNEFLEEKELLLSKGYVAESQMNITRTLEGNRHVIVVYNQVFCKNKGKSKE